MRFSGPRPLRPPIVLAVDLSQPVADEPAASPLARLVSVRRPSLRELVDTLTEAADDPQVQSLLVRVEHPARSWAHAEELRDVVAAFSRSGKPTLAHAQSLGEAGDGTLAYYVATAFDEVHLQPSGDLGLTGLAAVAPFVGELLDKVGIVPQFGHRHEYKAAANTLTERGFTDAHREAVDRIVASHHEHLVAAIAAGRGVSHERAAELVDQGPKGAAVALADGLVDRLAYRDETVAAVKESAGRGARLMTLSGYRAARRLRALRPRRRTTVALIHGQGPIRVGRSRRSLLGASMGSDSVVTGFQQAIRDRRVKAILFRVDSPGGSAAASDAICRAVMRAREAGKPVVVSMGPVAGSGGYWVSMAADRIVAAPGTLTGSIGVVSGKLVTRGLGDRLGVTTDEAHRGRFALMFSSSQEFTVEQRERMDAFLDRVYDEFVDRVAGARSLDRATVHQHARGRVWTGEDAAARGLVDELGGYRRALASVRELVGLKTDAPLRMRALPRQSALQRLGVRQVDPEDLRALGTAALDGLRGAGLRDGGIADMPGWAASLR
ncbi:MAG TPA: signal peptide peptidase SppA [Egibacteraceae bacterium]|nr:signal peptide peptidase SppA [Egibacteraceae bacterium]